MSRKYVLLDASVVLPYYVQETKRSTRSLERISTIVDAVRHHHADVHLYIPNIVVAEVFMGFVRHCYSHWDPAVFKRFGGPGKTLHAKRYTSARNAFRRDIHNGALFYQYHLNRYHILALELIAPVDKSRKFYRKGQVRSMGASDLLIGSMALHLTRIHGRENVALVTTDRRMGAIFDKACRRLRPTTARKLGLEAAAKELGFGRWAGDIYPQVLELHKCSDAALRSFFGGWPLNTRKGRNRDPKA